MTSCVDIDEDIDLGFDVQELTVSLLEAVCESEECPYEACINVYVTHSDNVRVYNREYRDIDATTDVLSFPALDIIEGDFSGVEDDLSSNFDPESGELILGDIVINVDRVYSQAEEYGHSVKREFAFLTAHSLYHLCGYDHETEPQARIMEEKQEAVLVKLGITRESHV
jgi:probable rRNA maturation factor